MRHLGSIELEALRVERQRLSDEVDRLVWLRRLVVARRDLDVARLTGLGDGLWAQDGLSPVVRGLLGGAAAGTPELGELARAVRVLSVALDGARSDLDAATAELVRRYRATPGLCLGVGEDGPLVGAAGPSRGWAVPSPR